MARRSLKLLVPFSQATLNKKTAKLLSRSSEFWTKRAAQWWNITNPRPVFPRHVHGTKQSPPLPFESGKNTLPGMEKFLDQMEGRA